MLRCAFRRRAFEETATPRPRPQQVTLAGVPGLKLARPCWMSAAAAQSGVDLGGRPAPWGTRSCSRPAPAGQPASLNWRWASRPLDHPRLCRGSEVHLDHVRRPDAERERSATKSAAAVLGACGGLYGSEEGGLLASAASARPAGRGLLTRGPSVDRYSRRSHSGRCTFVAAGPCASPRGFEPRGRTRHRRKCPQARSPLPGPVRLTSLGRRTVVRRRLHCFWWAGHSAF